MSQQISYFYNAEKIISLHGSGLVWLNFCKPNTKVIELLPPWCKNGNYLKHDFWVIGNNRNLDYKSLYVDELVGDKLSTHNFDIKVAPQILLELLGD